MNWIFQAKLVNAEKRFNWKADKAIRLAEDEDDHEGDDDDD